MKLTQSHLTRFEFYVRKWQAKLGLQDWEIHVRWKQGDDERTADSRASVNADTYGGIASVELTQDWDSYTKAGDRELEFMAFHELCHVLLSKMIRVTESYPMMTGGIREMAEHEVIRKLEYLTLGPKST